MGSVKTGPDGGAHKMTTEKVPHVVGTPGIGVQEGATNGVVLSGISESGETGLRTIVALVGNAWGLLWPLTLVPENPRL